MNTKITHRPIVITRHIRAAKLTAVQLRAAGADKAPIVISPLIKIHQYSQKLDLNAGQAVVFTSENGVLAAPIPPEGITAWCVGNRTAHAAQEKGYNVIVANGNAENLIAILISSAPKSPLVWLRGNHIAVDIEKRLRKVGITICSKVLYDQVHCQLTEEAVNILKSKSCIIPIFSPRTAAIFSKSAIALPNLDHVIVCHSLRVRDTLELDWNTEIVANTKQLIETTVRFSIQNHL